MSLLEEIQTTVVEQGTDISPILLKLRLLAARLRSAPLEAWVKHESQGYPADAQLPDYRFIAVSYTGNFSGPFGSGYRNAPIPPVLIKKFAGEHWIKYECRQSIASIDDLIRSSAKDGGGLTLDASNLILLLQGKVYEGYACNAIVGSVARTSLIDMQHAVRSRVLEFTIELEKSVPEAAAITFGSKSAAVSVSPEKVSQITYQTIYGGVTSIASSGGGATFNISVRQGDENSITQALVAAGIPESDAREFAGIVSSEQPESKDQPFGAKAKAWVVENLKKAATGTWKMGISVATQLFTAAALHYYGLK